MLRLNCWRILDTGGKKKKLLTLIRRRNFLGNTLKQFSLNSEGGDSLFTLSHLCSLNKNDIITYVIPNPQDYHKSYVIQCDVIFKIPSSRVLDKPLLISSFRAQDYFHTSSEVSVLGIPKTPPWIDVTPCLSWGQEFQQRESISS